MTVTLTPDKIEQINAYGPFNHSVWQADGVEITHEERLAGRGNRAVELIRQAITSRFSHDELSQMTITDVGCYDGWMLHQLSDLPFKKMVGIEPREKNIQKGAAVREILGIETRVEFQVGDVSSLAEHQFDIVLCMGVVHHLESPAAAIRFFKQGCRKFLFMETICLSSEHITDAFKREIEMKDLIYSYKDKICGISGQKFESAYYDGSAAELTVVSIPSPETLKMHLDLHFDEVTVVADSASYMSSFSQNDRPFNAICLSAVPSSDNANALIDEQKWIVAYEQGLADTVLDRSLVEPLYNHFHGHPRGSGDMLFFRLMLWYCNGSDWLANLGRKLAGRWLNGQIENELITNVRFNPPDKLALEYGKTLHKAGETDAAIRVLEQVTQKLNADWRCVYRSFSLLYQIYRDAGDDTQAQRYRELTTTCNPKLVLD